jgi:hypothetical protein
MSYRIIPPNHAAQITISVEQGLLLTASPVMGLIIQSAMARALLIPLPWALIPSCER